MADLPSLFILAFFFLERESLRVAVVEAGWWLSFCLLKVTRFPDGVPARSFSSWRILLDSSLVLGGVLPYSFFLEPLRPVSHYPTDGQSLKEVFPLDITSSGPFLCRSVFALILFMRGCFPWACPCLLFLCVSRRSGGSPLCVRLRRRRCHTLLRQVQADSLLLSRFIFSSPKICFFFPLSILLPPFYLHRCLKGDVSIAVSVSRVTSKWGVLVFSPPPPNPPNTPPPPLAAL